jgi:hypothetical protein
MIAFSVVVQQSIHTQPTMPLFTEDILKNKVVTELKAICHQYNIKNGHKKEGYIKYTSLIYNS